MIDNDMCKRAVDFGDPGADEYDYDMFDRVQPPETYNMMLTPQQTPLPEGSFSPNDGAFSPIDGIGPDELRVRELIQRVREGGIEEVVLATNPNAEGDATAHYLAEQLRETAALEADRV